MIRLTDVVRVILALIHFLTPIWCWGALTTEERVGASQQTKIWICDLSEEEFELFSAVVEAESDRTDNLEAKTYVALTIWNRVYSDDWPNTVTGVITQDGQFQVYYEGTYEYVGGNELSDTAIVDALAMRNSGDYPNVIYFNCIGYDGLGTPYACIGDNYFSTVP